MLGFSKRLLFISELFLSSIIHMLFGFYIFSSAVAADLSRTLIGSIRPNYAIEETRIRSSIHELREGEASSFPNSLPPIVLVHGIFGFGKGVWKLGSPLSLSFSLAFVLALKIYFFLCFNLEARWTIIFCRSREERWVCACTRLGFSYKRTWQVHRFKLEKKLISGCLSENFTNFLLLWKIDTKIFTRTGFLFQFSIYVFFLFWRNWKFMF